jgi:hypothetical protein
MITWFRKGVFRTKAIGILRETHGIDAVKFDRRPEAPSSESVVLALLLGRCFELGHSPERAAALFARIYREGLHKDVSPAGLEREDTTEYLKWSKLFRDAGIPLE